MKGESEPTRALRTKRVVDYTLGFLAAVFVFVGALLLIAAGVSVGASRGDVTAETLRLGPGGGTSALRLAPVSTAGVPGEGAEGVAGTVIVVHGFAGSKEFMRELAYSVARAGFCVVAVDLPGHAHSGLRLDGDLLVPWFSDLLDSLPGGGGPSGGPLYLVGHSLGTLVVTRGALENPDAGIRAVVALSPIYSEIEPARPANYLALFGEGELPGVAEAAREALRRGTGLDDPALDTLYGDFVAGTARAAGSVKGSTHTSIPSSRQAIERVIEWLYSAAGLAGRDLPRVESERAERGFGLVGAVLLWLGLFYLGAGVAGLLGHAPRRPDARAVVEDARKAAGLPPTPPPARSGQAEPSSEIVTAARAKATQLFAATRVVPISVAVAAVAAALVPGYLGPLGLLRQAVTDYLVVYLLVFTGVMTPFVVFLGGLLRTGPLVSTRMRVGPLPSAALGLALGLLALVVFGGFGSFTWTNLWPGPGRWSQVALLAGLLMPFSVLDELIRTTIQDRTGLVWALFVAVIGKLTMALTWYGGLVLPHPPYTLFVVMPFAVAVFVILDFAASLVYNEHGSWPAGAVFKAVTLAWLLGTVFPVTTGSFSF